MSDGTITEGTWACVTLHDGCSGDGHRPLHPAEDTARVPVTAVGEPGEHCVFALYKGVGRSGSPMPPGGLGLGRHLRPDELEPAD